MRKIFLVTLFLFSTFILSAQIKLQNGDILVRNVHNFNLLYHYGIVYKGKIVEFNESGIQFNDLQDFLGDKKIIYIDSTLRHTDDISKKIEKAISIYRHKEWTLKDNCESFINYIGRNSSISFQYEIIDSIINLFDKIALKNKWSNSSDG